MARVPELQLHDIELRVRDRKMITIAPARQSTSVTIVAIATFAHVALVDINGGTTLNGGSPTFAPTQFAVECRLAAIRHDHKRKR